MPGPLTISGYGMVIDLPQLIQKSSFLQLLREVSSGPGICPLFFYWIVLLAVLGKGKNEYLVHANLATNLQKINNGVPFIWFGVSGWLGHKNQTSGVGRSSLKKTRNTLKKNV